MRDFLELRWHQSECQISTDLRWFEPHPTGSREDSSYAKDNLVRRAESGALELVQAMHRVLARGAELESSAES